MAAIFSLTLYSTNAHAKITEEEEKYIQTITNDFEGTHNINLDSYELYDIRKSTDKDSLTTKEISLINIYLEIVKKQDFIDCSPLIFTDIKNNKGFVLEKKVNGMNNLHILSYDNATETWKVTNKNNKMGTELKDLGLLKDE